MYTQPRIFVFVLMPFLEEFRDVYEVGIKQACKDAGAYCERVDEQIFAGNILERIYNQIAKADVIVADTTGRNANVFYEIGYAHALNKQVILLANQSSEIPFDLKHFPHIIYEGSITRLKDQLETRIRWCAEHPPQKLSDVDLNLEFSINGVLITKAPVVEFNSIGNCYFNIDINNPSGKVVKPDSFNLALIIPQKARFISPDVLSAAKMPDGQYIFAWRQIDHIFPFGWFSLKVEFQLQTSKNREFTLILRFFTEMGFKDYPFLAKHR